MNDDKTRQQIVEKIANSANILVTVSKDPSVDALSAALALTIMLNKLSKHTTAIFSGAMPPAITFLDPQKTFESSTDGLRDFIIALDKEKADHLRYKVDGDVVKIFITPYKTTISDKDLEFSQGDYNVELVIALGVENQAHLDSALEAHGSILHDATVITVSTGQASSSLGSIDWQDESASSLSEMLVTLADIIKVDAPLVDQQVATALLTGIVAETDRFSNTKTSSRVMTIAAQLMAAGADQQLIAAKLQASHEIGTGAVQSNGIAPQPIGETSPMTDGLAIDHGDVVTPVETAPVAEAYSEPAEESIPEVPIAEPVNTSNDVPTKLADAYALDPESAVETAAPTAPTEEPLLGGVTMPAPAATPPPPEVVDQHSYLSDTPSFVAPSGASQPSANAGSSDILSRTDETPTAPIAPPSTLTLAPITPTIEPAVGASAEVVGLEESPDAVAPDALAPQAFSPAPGIVLPPPPPLPPDFGALPSTMSSAYAPDPTPAPQPERLGDILAEPPAQPASNDPGQFQIPGQ